MNRRDLTMEVIEAIECVAPGNASSLFETADAVVERLYSLGLRSDFDEGATALEGQYAQALAFYADPRHYQGTGDGTSYGPHDVGVLVDGGSIARKALGRAK